MLPGGKAIWSGPGEFPRLSPDGGRLAFVRNESVVVRDLKTAGERGYLRGEKAKGLGAWSPDGRLLPVGAWKSRLALEKKLFILDTDSGMSYPNGSLGDGDYGNWASWVSPWFLSVAGR